MKSKWTLACLIAVILGVFAYSAFINIERDENPNSGTIVGH